MGRRADLLRLGRVCGSAGNSYAPGAVVGTLTGAFDYRPVSGMMREVCLAVPCCA